MRGSLDCALCASVEMTVENQGRPGEDLRAAPISSSGGIHVLYRMNLGKH